MVQLDDLEFTLKTIMSLVAGLVLAFGTVADVAASPRAQEAVANDLHGSSTTRLPRAAAPLAAEVVDASTGSVIYSNFDTSGGDIYQCLGGWLVSTINSGQQTQQAMAMPFTPATDARLDKIYLGVGIGGGTNQLSVSLQLSDRNGLPGTVVGQLEVANFGPTDTCSTTVVRGAGATLQAGTTYWIVLTAAGDTWATWGQNSTGAVGQAYKAGNANWKFSGLAQGAFAVTAR